MKEAPRSVLHALFDAATAVDGCMLTIFESHHPGARDAFRSWCAERNRRADYNGTVVHEYGAYEVIGTLSNGRNASITIHLDGHRKAA